MMCCDSTLEPAATMPHDVYLTPNSPEVLPSETSAMIRTLTTLFGVYFVACVSE